MPKNLKSITVSCFGKLPKFGDFVRINASSQQLQRFDHWLQEGLYYAKKSLSTRFDSIFDESPIRRFIFPLPELKSMLIGVLIPGRDKVGRRYPFYYTVSLPISMLKRDSLSHQILHILPFLNNCVDNHERVINMEQTSEITSHLEEMSRWISPENNQLIGEYHNWTQNISASELLSLHNKDNQGLSEIFDELRKPIPPTNKLGWFLHNPQLDAQHSFLVPVIIDIFRNTNSNIPTVFWNLSGEAPGTILFFPNQPAPKVVTDLIQNTHSSTHFHASAAATVSGGASSVSELLIHKLKDVSLEQFIHSYAR